MFSFDELILTIIYISFVYKIFCEKLYQLVVHKKKKILMNRYITWHCLYNVIDEICTVSDPGTDFQEGFMIFTRPTSGKTVIACAELMEIRYFLEENKIKHKRRALFFHFNRRLTIQ